MRAARYAHVPTWELEAQPYTRTLEYLEAERAELAAEADRERTRQKAEQRARARAARRRRTR